MSVIFRPLCELCLAPGTEEWEKGWEMEKVDEEKQGEQYEKMVGTDRDLAEKPGAVHNQDC